MAEVKNAASKELELLNMIKELKSDGGNKPEQLARTVYRLAHISVILPVQVHGSVADLKTAVAKAQQTGKLNLDEAGLSVMLMENKKGESFLPCYTSEEQSGPSTKDIRFIKLSMIHLVQLLDNIKDADCILLNPFTTDFVIPSVLVEQIKKLCEDEMEKRLAGSDK